MKKFLVIIMLLIGIVMLTGCSNDRANVITQNSTKANYLTEDIITEDIITEDIITEDVIKEININEIEIKGI